MATVTWRLAPRAARRLVAPAALCRPMPSVPAPLGARATASWGSWFGPGSKPPPKSGDGDGPKDGDEKRLEKKDTDAEGAGDTTLVPLGGGSGTLARDDVQPLEPQLLALPLPRRPLFPGQQQALQVTHPKIVQALLELMAKGAPPRLVTLLRRNGDASADEAEHAEDLKGLDPFEALHHIGTRARIVQVQPVSDSMQPDAPPAGLHLLLHGQDLVRLDKVLSPGPPLLIQAKRHVAKKAPDAEAALAVMDADAEDAAAKNVKAHVNEIMRVLREIMKINAHFREHATMIHRGFQHLDSGDPTAIAHFAASLTTSEGEELMEVLISDDPLKKLQLSLNLLKKELDLSQLQQKISTQIEDKVSKTQREFFLREQLSMIKKELGEDKSDGSDELVAKYKKRLEGKEVPKDADEVICSELEKFAGLAKQSQEYQITQNYLDWLTSLPWGVRSEDTLRLRKAREVLDRDHHGLADVKQRILELIAVGSLKQSVQGKIICMVGPPGVGKTSIGRSIAEALGREFYRFSVGGLHDVAEIKGHRRTYVGAMPGKVVQCLKKTQTENPLVLIDEIDKLGRGHQGDPASALLELLDPSQNSSFLDHYLDVPVDASRVLFVCTANSLDTIPGPLLDRMEVIQLSGYDTQEKLKIAQDYLVPNAMREIGLWPSDKSTDEANEEASEEGPAEGRASIDESALMALIRWYCREAGVRRLQQHIEKLCRKLALKVVERRELEAEPDAEKAEPLGLCVTESQLNELVGRPRFTSDRLYEGAMPLGTVTGLAWTSLGGEVLYVETVALPKPGAEGSAPRSPPSLSITGRLGDVMKESAKLALLVARRQLAARAPERQHFLEEHELHVHCPEGATPKDGPSAGVTMTTALLSLSLGRPCRPDLAMTGEVSLNGKVLPVGGIKEKVVAARRAGCRAVALPAGNRRDFGELPEYLREGLEVTFASDYNDVFEVAFAEPPASS